MGANKIRLYLVDDQILFVDMLKGIIEHRTDDMIVAGSADSGEALERKLEGARPDILLLDVRMPGEDGVALLDGIKRRFPELKVVMLTTFGDLQKAQKALRKGASGFLLKNSSVNDLIEKIRTIQSGDVVISSPIARRIFQAADSDLQAGRSGKRRTLPESLSRREAEVYDLLIQGYSNSEIAEKLFIARQTVKNHIYSIYSKTGCHNRVKIIFGSS